MARCGGWTRIGLELAGAGWLLGGAASAQPAFVTFESAQVRPLALSPDGARLFAVNTPDARLEIFRVASAGLVHEGSVPVGLEPVAVAARSDSEVWVVNHLSDSVSIVDVPSRRVVRTLLVGDEPNDVVFAGPGGNRAFVSAAHRGQNTPWPRGDYDVPGIGRADVWVFDRENLGSPLGGTPETVVSLFGDKPRALAVSPDGSRVYAAVFHSGNQTTTITEGLVCNGGAAAAPCGFDDVVAPGGLPAPNQNHEGAPGPEVGLIVKLDRASGEWRDELARDWSSAVRFDLPDLDVFAIDAAAATPVEVASLAHVGTVLFDLAVHPETGVVYVSNTEARNEVRFEGPGTLASAEKPPGVPATVRGHLHEARITVIDGTDVRPRHLNRHIDYEATPMPAATKQASLATPMGIAIRTGVGGAPDTLYVAAFGSSRIGVYDVASLEDGSFDPLAASDRHIEVSGGGPTGLVLDPARERLYVLTRFDDSISVVDLATGGEIAHVALHNPEPPHVVGGRPFLYDANLTSSNGEASCAACHVFGDLDDLAWDLGNPDDDVLPNPNLFAVGSGGPFHPLKGPMTTQSLRGLAVNGPMHWRGDRTGGNAAPPVSTLDEGAAFDAFNVAFGGLLGRDEGPLPAADMQAFTAFALEITYPPNPIRRLDNVLRADEQLGRDHFFRNPGPDIFVCNQCHVLDAAQGQFGTGGRMSVEGETQEFKVPHLRNVYQKVGMFGMPNTPFMSANPGENEHTGAQIRGFGLLHDGSIDTVLRFLRANVFPLFAAPVFAGDTGRRALEAFMMAFDSNLAPIVGQQVTLRAGAPVEVTARVDLLVARAAAAFPMPGAPGARECDLVAKLRIGGRTRGYVRRSNGLFEPDDGSGLLTDAQLRALAAAPEQEVTYTCAPPGSGERMGVDRDLDGSFDGLDNCPAAANAGQVDADGDAVGDACDRCTGSADADQRDSDGDGFGNACDADLDQSGLVNLVDLALFRQRFFTADADADFDGDGLVNLADLARFRSLFLQPPGPSALAP
jgi:YVTN family beta-propeller protein